MKRNRLVSRFKPRPRLLLDLPSPGDVAASRDPAPFPKPMVSGCRDVRLSSPEGPQDGGWTSWSGCLSGERSRYRRCRTPDPRDCTRVSAPCTA